MADFKLRYGLKAAMPSYSSALEGAMLVATDERAIYMNLGGSQFRIGDFQVVAEVADLPDPTSAGTQLFFVSAINALTISNGTRWIQLNSDTGATSIAFSGGSGTDGAPASGEFISGASYDASTRAITLTVSTISADMVTYGNSNVKATLDNKTTQTLNGTNGKAIIWNESDGGGVKFEHNDGTYTFLGVNDGGASGINGQIYSVDHSTNTGMRLNITKNGLFYTTNKNTYAYSAEDELVTKKDLITGSNEKDLYIVDDSSSQNTYAGVYKFYQGLSSTDMSQNTLIGTINIPKDLVIKSGSVKSVSTADVPYTGAKVGEKFLEIVIQNQTDPIYIPVNDLIDIYTAQQNATQIQLNIDANNEISASVIAGSITSTELAAKSVTAEKLDDTAIALFDVAGAAAAVLGTNTDTSSDKTVYGAIALAQEQADKLTWVQF